MGRSASQRERLALRFSRGEIKLSEKKKGEEIEEEEPKKEKEKPKKKDEFDEYLKEAYGIE